MQSIFDKETDRRGTGSMKWDVHPGGTSHVGSGYGF